MSPVSGEYFAEDVLGATLRRKQRKQIVEPIPQRKRGRPGSRPARVSTTDLDPGMRSTLARFESSVRIHAMKGAMDPESWNAIEAEYINARQALLRKLLRLEGKLPQDTRGRKRGSTK